LDILSFFTSFIDSNIRLHCSGVLEQYQNL